MDEFSEFSRAVLETLRQPIETGEVMVARANAHIKYPCKFMLVAAANPCKCGYLPDPARACARVPHCGDDYMARISGPLMDRFDLRVDVPPVAYTDLDLPATGDASATISARVAAARAVQHARFASQPDMLCNADATPPCTPPRIATLNVEGDAVAQGGMEEADGSEQACGLDAEADSISADAERPPCTEQASARILRSPRPETLDPKP